MDEELRFKKYLASQKLKYTPERRRIFKEIIESDKHFAAEELVARLKSQKHRVSRATVYRTLDLLSKLGLVNKVCMGDKPSLYESARSRKRQGRLVCVSCGKIQRFSDSEMNRFLDSVCENFEFRPKSQCIQISGYCQACAEEVPSDREGNLWVIANAS
ncbi:transcriptional repressor [candidate division KSB1 bacterium]|nr:transcriptional repressor [candidate division KSB1 bacterium]NIR69828.1 transcriptional repressor [candidate division KSB1 bacterium]NIS24375.1 transcriptional repressor [candidate division KSB1 bacterium]NIT71311.1 transcriptional repressor [candidate division KSB1 bacterium]NIU27606.1 transcriptional repressor [candidate division KSB1 bacterium]